MKVSDCCKAKIIQDVCQRCKRLANTVLLCEDCDGEGKYEELDRGRIHANTITPPYIEVECETCQGNGYIELPENYEDEDE